MALASLEPEAMAGAARAAEMGFGETMSISPGFNADVNANFGVAAQVLGGQSNDAYEM